MNTITYNAGLSKKGLCKLGHLITLVLDERFLPGSGLCCPLQVSV